MAIDRRRFLALTAAGGAASLVLPGWLARAFAQEPPAQGDGATTGLPTLVAAFRDAQRLGKPLLVLVVPGPTESYERARAFGELLNHGPDEAMLDLSLAHVVCATSADVRTLAPQTPAGQPWMVLLETDAVPARVRAVDAGLTPAQLEATDDAAVDVRIAALASAIHQALGGTPGLLAARARVARAHLDARTLASVDAASRGQGRLDPATADRAAAVVLAAGAVRLGPAVLAGVTARLRVARIPGSVWASSSGCGVDIEGGEPSMVDCGMGHVPPRSARFLQFYVRH